MSRSRVERVERVERERLSGRRRVNVARVITPLPPTPLGLSLPLTNALAHLLPCYSRSLALPLYLSVYPSLLRSPPPCRNPPFPLLTIVPAPRSLAYDTTRFSRGPFSLGLSRPFISPRLVSPLDFHSVRATLLAAAPSSIRRCFSPPFPSLCEHVYRCKPLSISHA